jgi:hypothetical protein
MGFEEQVSISTKRNIYIVYKTRGNFFPLLEFIFVHPIGIISFQNVTKRGILTLSAVMLWCWLVACGSHSMSTEA